MLMRHTERHLMILAIIGYLGTVAPTTFDLHKDFASAMIKSASLCEALVRHLAQISRSEVVRAVTVSRHYSLIGMHGPQ